MKKIIYCLVKIFNKIDEVHADSFLNSGEMYCRALKKFKEIEDNETRGDRYEGLTHWIQPKDAIITLKLEKSIEGVPNEIIIKENDLAAPTVIQSTEYDFHNVYCMYAIAIDDFKFEYSTEEERLALQKEINNKLSKQIEIDNKVSSELGNVAIVITNVKEFIGRVKEYSDENVHHGFVEYFEEKSQTALFAGMNAIFKKRSIYAYQNEYRFVFVPKENLDCRIFSIGNLEDIAYKTTIDELQNSINVTIQ
ncbi:MAG TPA: hypothetical protein VMV48_11080 [Gallionellaceae bacterium]|nr:hypothetical protein [Gallionellaceae bacterium]